MYCLGAAILGVTLAPLMLLHTGSFGVGPWRARVPTAPFSENPQSVERPNPQLDGKVAVGKAAAAVGSTSSSVAAAVSTTPSSWLSHSGEHLVVQTMHGNITMRFRADKAPKHVEYMRTLVHRKAYDGCSWYRAERNFVLQGGLRTAAGQVFSAGVPSPPLEYALPNKRGFVNMARWEDPNSAGGDFCILLKDSPHLDRTGTKGYAAGFTVWAEVVSGMDVADLISKGETKSVGGLNMLRDPVTFLSVSLI
jgi:cyclophilin family peptidyl-prolyl cis-trans isomerase